MGYSPEEIFSCSVTVQGQTIPIASSSFNLSFSDSIYELCPQIVLSGNDVSGIASESRLGIIGQEVLFSIDAAGTNMKLPMVCRMYETPQSNSANGISGTIKLVFQHSAKYTDRKNAAWQGKSPAYVFSNTIQRTDAKKMSSCNTLSMIYNPGYDFEEFTDKILLKTASNGSPQSSPYYAFVDIRNSACFLSLKDMLQSSPVKKIIFGQPLDTESDSVVALKMNSFSQDYAKISPFVDETITFFNQKNEIETQDVSLNKMFNPLALMKNTSSINPRTPENSLHPVSPVVEYAKLNMERRKGLTFDKFTVLTFLDPSLHAGQMVEVDAYLDVPGSEKAESFSGRFLIEASEHTWSASELMGYTKLIIGRPTMQVRGKELYQ